MSIIIETYLPRIDNDLINPWLLGLEELGMKCELHPDFSFPGDMGFLPIKLRLMSPTRKSFENIDFLSGFELYVDDFDFAAFSALKKKQSRRVFDFLWRSGAQPSAISPDVDAILATCRKCLTFRFSPADLFELRLADLSSILLMEISDGVRFLPLDNEWHFTKGDARNNLQSIEEFERSLPEDGYTVHPFEEWR